MQNIRKIFSLDSENNAYKVVGQSWSKKSFSKPSWLSLPFTYKLYSLWKFRKVLVVDFENSAFEVSDLGVKWRNFGVSKSFHEVFSVSILFTYSTLAFKISENV